MHGFFTIFFIIELTDVKESFFNCVSDQVVGNHYFN